MKHHPTGVTIADKNVWSAHAAEIGKLHAIAVDDIDKGSIFMFKPKMSWHVICEWKLQKW